MYAGKQNEEKKGMILQTILEGLGLGALLILVCAGGIRKGTIGMAVIAAVLAAIMTIFLY